MELVSLNIRVPHITDLEVLEVMGAGIMVLFDGYMTLGKQLDDTFIIDEAKLTMGDHTADLEPCSDERFDQLFKAAESGLEFVLAAQFDELKFLADHLTGADDIIMSEYPGLIRMYVEEGKVASATYQRFLPNIR